MSPQYKVCIDPGHGGSDPGAVGPNGVREKDVTLEVALRVVKHLQQHGVQVKLTRENDKYVSLAERCRISNNFSANAFVSIHCNSAANPTASGMEVWTSRGQTEGDKLADYLAQELQKNFSNLHLRSDMTDSDLDKEADFHVLRYTRAPAALVELAFISTPEEEKLLRSADFQEKAAEAIAKGIGKFIGIQIMQEVFSMFKDVPANHWAAKDIEWLAEKGIFRGDGQGNFGLGKTVTREELAAVIARVLRLLEVK
jgi:N-acetylmuramoyl-L-alanine amidase